MRSSSAARKRLVSRLERDRPLPSATLMPCIGSPCSRSQRVAVLEAWVTSQLPEAWRSSTSAVKLWLSVLARLSSPCMEVEGSSCTSTASAGIGCRAETRVTLAREPSAARARCNRLTRWEGGLPRAGWVSLLISANG
jgi:hypothetical protein